MTLAGAGTLHPARNLVTRLPTCPGGEAGPASGFAYTLERKRPASRCRECKGPPCLQGGPEHGRNDEWAACR